MKFWQLPAVIVNGHCLAWIILQNLEALLDIQLGTTAVSSTNHCESIVYFAINVESEFFEISFFG